MNGYGQEYEDLFWWIKRSLMAGMNAQVLHGASYSGAYYGKYSENGNVPGVTWPGYEGFRKAISNYWNRTLSVSDARDCLDTIARMNTIFMKKAKVDCAIYKADYLNEGLGSDFYIYSDDGALSNYGYSYETVSPTILEMPVCKVEGRILDKSGVGYKCLIIPEQRAVSMMFLKKAEVLLDAGFPVLWMGNKPEYAFFYTEWNTKEKRQEWQEWMDRVWERKELIHFDSLAEVPNILLEQGILPEIELDGKNDIITAVRKDEEADRTYYALYAFNRVEYTPDKLNHETLAAAAFYRKETIKPFYKRDTKKMQVPVKLRGEGTVYKCDPWSGKMSLLDFTSASGWSYGNLTIEEDEMVILALVFGKETEDCQYEKEVTENHLDVCFDTLELYKFVPDHEGETSFLRSHYTEFKKIDLKNNLQPWYLLEPELEHFAGKGIYQGYFEVKEKAEDTRYILKLGDASDTFRVWVNGNATDFPDQILKEVDVTELVKDGTNELKIEVTSTLYNCINGPLRNTPDAFFKRPLFYSPKKYGIWNDKNRITEILVRKIKKTPKN